MPVRELHEDGEPTSTPGPVGAVQHQAWVCHTEGIALPIAASGVQLGVVGLQATAAGKVWRVRVAQLAVQAPHDPLRATCTLVGLRRQRHVVAWMKVGPCGQEHAAHDTGDRSCCGWPCQRSRGRVVLLVPACCSGIGRLPCACHAWRLPATQVVGGRRYESGCAWTAVAGVLPRVGGHAGAALRSGVPRVTSPSHASVAPRAVT